MTDQRLRLAVFIDFDNIEIGVKNTLNASFDAGIVLEALKERGDVVSKTAYSDWQRAGGHSRGLTQHAIKMVQRNLTPGGDKNGADINLALDALEMAFTHPHINAFVIVGGDSDFISLVERLKQYDKKVFIVGGRQFTSAILQRNCHEFIAYENLMGPGVSAATTGSGGRRQGGRNVRVERTPVEQAIPLVQRALAVLSEREVSPQLGLLKSTLLQLDSTFSERSYGAGSFRDFVEKLAKSGVLKVYQGKGGWLVGQADGASTVTETSSDEGDAHNGAPHPTVAPDAILGDDVVPHVAAPHAPSPQQSVGHDRGSAVSHERGSAASHAGGHGAGSQVPVAVIGSLAEGLAEFRRILGSAEIRRWPMYLRNVKQVFRQVTPVFDERAYGYASLVDLLRAAQKEGLVRMDRDRQGVVRVFQGAAAPARPVVAPEHAAQTELQAEAAPAPAPVIEIQSEEDTDLSVGPGNTIAGPPRHLEISTVKRPRRARTAPPKVAKTIASRRTRKKTE